MDNLQLVIGASTSVAPPTCVPDLSIEKPLGHCPVTLYRHDIHATRMPARFCALCTLVPVRNASTDRERTMRQDEPCPGWSSPHAVASPELREDGYARLNRTTPFAKSQRSDNRARTKSPLASSHIALPSRRRSLVSQLQSSQCQHPVTRVSGLPTAPSQTQ